MHRLIYILLLGAVVTACTTDFDIDQTQIEDKIVIEGVVSTSVDSSLVIVSRLINDYSSVDAIYIRDAVVSITDDVGNKYEFVNNLNNRSENGIYIPDIGFKGEVGRSYRLSVTVAGKTYTATDYLSEVPKIEKLEYERVPDNEIGEFENLAYQVMFSAPEPQDEDNYYYIRYFRNGILYGESNEVYAFSDKPLSDELKALPLRSLYAIGDVASVELFSISEGVYKDYPDLGNVLGSDGGMFTSPAANPVTNISNGALGIFFASDVSRMEITIK